MRAPVDDLTPDWLVSGVSIGDVLERLEVRVVEAVEWRRLEDDNSVSNEVLSAKLDEWYGGTFVDLMGTFTSKSNGLRFRVASAPALSPPRANYRAMHGACSVALIEIREQVIAERSSIARAIEELEKRVAEHSELLELIRENNVYSAELWKKVVQDPKLASPVTALLNYGVSQNAMWDLMKFVFTLAIASGHS